MKYLQFFLLIAFAQMTWANQCTDLMQKKDFYEASDVCQSMAQKGDKNAQFSLALMYYEGNGLMVDLAQAQKWMRKAALQNYNQAQYNLGIMIANGQGSSADLVEAFAWLNIAAENGYSAAADSVKQLGDELSSAEKDKAVKQIVIIKKSFK